MAPPITRETGLRLALADYLQSEFESADSAIVDMDWLYYSDVIAPGDTPKGSVILSVATPQENANFRYTPIQRQALLRLLVANATAATALQHAESWRYLMATSEDSMLIRLGQLGTAITEPTTGLEVEFSGLSVDSTRLSQKDTQDDGAVLQLLVECSWLDGA